MHDGVPRRALAGAGPSHRALFGPEILRPMLSIGFQMKKTRPPWTDAGSELTNRFGRLSYYLAEIEIR